MIMPLDMTGRVALVTGGGSGIGAASALKLAKAGAKVAVLARDEDELKQIAAQIGEVGSEGMVIVGDISDVRSMQKAYQQIENQWGRLDVVFANAGINGTWAPLGDLSEDDWDQTLDINLKGTFLTIKYALPLLRKRGGSVIVTSSVNGTRIFSNTGATAYSCSKAGQVALTKMLALELASERIRVNVICPGAIETDIEENTERENLESAAEPVEFPAGKIPLTDGTPGSSEQVSDLVLFLASDASSHITGTEIWIDGGQSLLQG